ncbi:MAG: MgPME-cyclase complex family protein [Pleurocapsa sp.]
MTTYFYVAASQKFLLEEEPFEEVIAERIRNYQEQNKERDFWLVKQPAFLEAPELAEVKAKIPQPAAAVISTNSQFITWLKLRLEYVARGEFEAPSASIRDPLASLEVESRK